jgi:hypothetical protein
MEMPIENKRIDASLFKKKDKPLLLECTKLCTRQILFEMANDNLKTQDANLVNLLKEFVKNGTELQTFKTPNDFDDRVIERVSAVLKNGKETITSKNAKLLFNIIDLKSQFFKNRITLEMAIEHSNFNLTTFDQSTTESTENKKRIQPGESQEAPAHKKSKHLEKNNEEFAQIKPDMLMAIAEEKNLFMKSDTSYYSQELLAIIVKKLQPSNSASTQNSEKASAPGMFSN